MMRTEPNYSVRVPRVWGCFQTRAERTGFARLNFCSTRVEERIETEHTIESHSLKSSSLQRSARVCIQPQTRGTRSTAFSISILSLALVISFLCNASLAQEPAERERTFARALELLEHARTPDEYRRAATEFEAMGAEGYMNGGVLYDIGNSYMGAHDYGRAIAAYRKARLFRPRDPFLDAILREAVTLAPGKLPEPPAPWWTHALFWTRWLSYPEKLYSAFAGWALGAALVFAGVYFRSKRPYWLAGAAVFLALLFSIDVAVSWQDVFQPRHAVVVQETIARKGNSPDYQPAFDQALKDGAEFTIIDRRGDWVLGHFEGAGDGWVSRAAIAE
jgi:hypothetical protein